MNLEESKKQLKEALETNLIVLADIQQKLIFCGDFTSKIKDGSMLEQLENMKHVLESAHGHAYALRILHSLVC